MQLDVLDWAIARWTTHSRYGFIAPEQYVMAGQRQSSTESHNDLEMEVSEAKGRTSSLRVAGPLDDILDDQ